MHKRLSLGYWCDLVGLGIIYQHCKVLRMRGRM